MPCLAFDQSTLNEVLEVRAEPLMEFELWCLLLQGSLALQKVLLKVEKERLLHLATTLSPDTIILCLNGRVIFGVAEEGRIERFFLAPEYSTKKKSIANNEIEKMLVYSLGMSILTSAENEAPSTTEFALSFEIESLICQMVEDTSRHRVTIPTIIQICKQHVNMITSQRCIQSLAEEIVGPYGLEQLPEETPLVLPNPNTLQEEYREHPFDPGPQNKKKELEEIEAYLFSKNIIEDRSFEFKKCYQIKSVESLVPLHHPLKVNASTQAISIDIMKEDKKFDQSISKLSPKTAWSPSFSAPDFKVLLDLSEKLSCLTNSGCSDESIDKHKSLCKSFSSMPMLNGLSRELKQGSSIKKNLYSFHKSEGKSLNNCASSSQNSLLRGAYMLDSEQMKYMTNCSINRSSSFGSISLNSDNGIKTMLHHSTQTNDLHNLQCIGLLNLGPEFVQVAANPDIAFIDISPPRLGPLSKGTRHISIILPNCQKVQTTVQVESKAKELFDQISYHFQIKETIYFGLTQLQDEDYVFLDLDSKLLKYAPTGWKDEKSTKKLEFVLYFKVKFFVSNPSILKQSITRHLYYLQVRQDILSGYTHCSDETLFILTGHALQAEYGNFEPNYSLSKYFQIEHYLPKRVLSRINKAEIWLFLLSMHKSNFGYSKEAAELEYLKEAKELQEYGVLFYQVSRSKKVKNDYVWFGICVKGLIVLEPKGNLRAAVHRQSWDLIKEFNFEKKKFVVKPKNPNANPKMKFYSSHYRRSKYLFQICQSFHRFHAFNQITGLDTVQSSSFNMLPHSGPIKVVQINKKPKESLGLTSFSRQDSQMSAKEVFIKHLKPDSVCDQSCSLEEGNSKLLSRFQISHLKRHKETEWVPASEKFDSMKLKFLGINFIDEDLQSTYSERAIDVPTTKIKTDSPVQLLSTLLHKDFSHKSCPIDQQLSEKVVLQNQFYNEAYVSSAEGSIYSDCTESVYKKDENYNGLKRTSGFIDLNNIGKIDKIENGEIENQLNISVNREEKETLVHSESLTKETIEEVEVELEKANGTFGISIVGGVDSTLPLGGIFVKSLLFGSAAHSTGKIREGDRILSVNGISLENVSHIKAVEILKHSPAQTTIVIDRGIVLSLDPISDPLNSKESVSSKDYVFEVEVKKNANGLGFSLVGGKNSDPVFKGMLMIKKMYSQQPIEMSGMFRIGDVILIVNDQIVEGMTHQEALSVIRNAPRNVRLVAKRLPENEIPNILFDDNKSVSADNLLENVKEKDVFFGRQCSVKVKNIAKELLQNIECSGTESFNNCTYSSGMGSDTDEPLESLSYSEVTANTFKILSKPNKTCNIELNLHNAGLEEVLQEPVQSASFSSYSNSPFLTSSPSIIENKPLKLNKSKKNDYKVNDHNMFVPCVTNQENVNFGTQKKQPYDVVLLLEKSERLIENTNSKSDVGINFKKQDYQPMNQTFCVNKHFIDSEAVNGYPRHRPENKHLSYQPLSKHMNDINDSVSFSMGSFNLLKPAKLENQSSIHTSPAVSVVPLPGSPMLKHLERWKRESSTESTSTKRSEGISSVGEVILVQLEKSESGLGLTLGSENIDNESFIFIKKIVKGSVAEECGRLQIGDRLLSINGKNVEQVSVKEVVSIFRSLAGTVTLECFRPPTCLSAPRYSNLPAVNICSSQLAVEPLILSNAPKVEKSNQINLQRKVTDCSLELFKEVSVTESKELTFNSSLQLLDSVEDCHKKLNFNTNISSNSDKSNLHKVKDHFSSDITHIESYFKNLEESNIVFEEASQNQSSLNLKVNNQFLMENLPVEVGWEENDNNYDVILNMDKEGVIKPSSKSSEWSYPEDGTVIENKHESILVNSSILQKSGIPLFKHETRFFPNSTPHFNPLKKTVDDEIVSEYDFYIERKLFNYYTKERLEKLVNLMECKMDAIDMEFLSIRQMKSNGTCAIGNRAINRVKNRFKTIVPYDQNRVELLGSEESDYINASHIKISIGGDIMRYIITQAPLENTVKDFWRCIWENKVELVVMLNDEFTSDNIKFPCYWPKSTSSPMRVLEKFEIILLHEEDYVVYKYRQIQLKNIKMDKSLFVTQAAYKQWPENDVPVKMVDYLGFMKFIQTYRNSLITLVHCSTGTSRSATFVIMDCVWNALERDVKFDLSLIAKSLKEQRLFVLQKKEDYMFCIKVAHHLLLDSLNRYK